MALGKLQLAGLYQEFVIPRIIGVSFTTDKEKFQVVWSLDSENFPAYPRDSAGAWCYSENTKWLGPVETIMAVQNAWEEYDAT